MLKNVKILVYSKKYLIFVAVIKRDNKGNKKKNVKKVLKF